MISSKKVKNARVVVQEFIECFKEAPSRATFYAMFTTLVNFSVLFFRYKLQLKNIIYREANNYTRKDLPVAEANNIAHDYFHKGACHYDSSSIEDLRRIGGLYILRNKITHSPITIRYLTADTIGDYIYKPFFVFILKNLVAYGENEECCELYDLIVKTIKKYEMPKQEEIEEQEESSEVESFNNIKF